MGSNLEHATLSSIADILMGQSPSGETCNEEGLGIPLLNGPSEFGTSHPTPVQFTTDSRRLAKKSDLLFCVRGSTTGRMNWADQNYSIGRGLAALRHKNGLEYQPYLKALIETILPDLLSSATGCTFPNVSRDQLLEAKVFIHSLDQQLAISRVLSSLDDKIELNRQMCKTLEDIANTLFKSWFIDFDPVKAKAAGREPEGLNSEIAKLFPASFASDSYELPKGWHFSVVYDLAEYINGAAYKDSHFTDAPDALPIIKIAELKSGISSGTKYSNTNLGDKYRIDTGNILLSWSGSPETSIDTFLWVAGAGWLNQHIFNVIPKLPESRAFLYFLLKYLKPIFINIAKNKQTTGLGHVTVKDLKEIKVAKPDIEVMKVFDSIVNPILQEVQNIMEQIVSLRKICDSILPKLISGNLKINELENK